ncbi:MAG TPA: extracellular solute-binding protein [Micromonosporaceae bacterium]|nr:extracellular solute-binding protein [Micromonosporaceae bacterium]
MKRSWSSRMYAAAVCVAALGLASACSGESGTGGNNNQPGVVTLKVAFWGDFGFGVVEDKFEEAHPNVRIVLDSGEYNAQHEKLQKNIIAGSGAADVAAIDEGFIVSFRSQADKFVDLKSKGAGSYESKYLPWKWQNSMSPDGKQIGLGTDVGGLAMCYRTDLFKAAGLPTDRDAVSKLWPDWASFINVGKQYVAKTGKKFVDSGTNVFNPVLGQQPVGFYDQSDALKMDGGPKVAFDTTVQVIQAGLSANLAAFSPEWNAGFTGGQFAVLACPAWMLGHIQNTAPGTRAKWDIAAIPGGGGNWGGSWLTVPAQSKNADLAYEFIKFFVEEQNQIDIFKKVGNLPSQPGLFQNKDLLDFKNPFFSDAPTGQIFTKAAQGLNPQYLGKKNGPTRVAVENVLNRVQAGTLPAADAWAEAVKEADKASKA